MWSAVCLVYGFGLLASSEALVSSSIHNDYNQAENSQQYIKDDGSPEYNQNSANHFSDTLPGDPDLDFPTYTDIPRTGFSCKGKVNWHYYADIETDCQVFHICETEYSKISFVCPIGSIFNQRHLVCDWWYNVDCTDSETLYSLSNNFYDQGLSSPLEESTDPRGFDLSPASSGGNSNSPPNGDGAKSGSHPDEKRPLARRRQRE